MLSTLRRGLRAGVRCADKAFDHGAVLVGLAVFLWLVLCVSRMTGCDSGTQSTITPAKSEAADHTVTQAPSRQRIVTTTIRIGGDGVAEYDCGGGR